MIIGVFFMFISELNENYKNFILNKDMKEKYKNEVWDLIQDSYSAIGGIKGSGFSSPDDMIKNIPFWKVYTKNNKVLMVVLYKEKSGRKLVALGIDGSPLQKTMLVKVIIQSPKNSFMELQSNLLQFTYKNIGHDIFTNFIISKDDIQNLLNKPVEEVDLDKLDTNDKQTYKKFPQLHEYFYMRDINGEKKLKLALGTPNKNIT